MGLSSFIYNHSPIWLQNMACSMRGRQIVATRYDAEFREILAFLNESQFWPLDQLQAYQDEQLASLIKHVYNTVPYYRRVMDERKLVPEDIRTTADLPKLPVLTKDIVRREGDNLRSRGFPEKQVVHMHTSGTTGAGLQFDVSARGIHYQWATWWRHHQRFGMDIGQPYANFSGQLVVPMGQRKPPFWRENRPMRQTYLSLYHMTPENMSHYVEMLESRDFAFYAGYPSGVYLLADYLRSINHKLTRPPKIITTGAESLMPFQVKAFEEWIGAPATEHYGLAEGSANMAHCEERNYHVDMEFCVLEAQPVSQRDDGTVCHVIGTGLHNYAQPFIRYDTGDMATFSDAPCPCGRQSPIATYIDGRVESYVFTPDGRRIGRLDHCFKDMVNISECQVVQDDISELKIRIVKADSYGPADEKQLLEEFRRHLGESIDLTLEYVDRIPRTKTGKFRAVISNIEKEHLAEMSQIESLLTSVDDESNAS
jgi:phenylacetate-CoA ligase